MRVSALVLSAAFLVPSAPVAAQAPTEPPTPYVETVGAGSRRVAPDRANVHLIVETRAETAAGAAAENSRTVAAVIDTLRRSGLDSAVTTASYHVGPNWEPAPGEAGSRARRGYMSRTVLRVRLPRIDNVGRVIDVGLAKGATGVEQVLFESSRADEERRASLAEAAAAARREADILARAMGGTLGRLISVSTTSSPGRVMYDNVNYSFGSVGNMQSTAITPNTIVINASVHTRWQFIPAP